MRRTAFGRKSTKGTEDQFHQQSEKRFSFSDSLRGDSRKNDASLMKA